VGPGEWRYWKWFRWLHALRRVFRETEPDVVHAFLFPSYALTAFAAHPLGTRVVAGIRSAGAGPEGRWPFSWFEGAGLARTHRIVVNAEAVRAALQRRHSKLLTPTQTIPNGVDTARFAGGDRAATRAELGVPQDALLVLMVANLIPYKGHRDALQAFARLRAQAPRAVLALAGSGPEAEPLRSLAAELGLQRAVLLLGQRSDVPRLCGAADVALLASHVEGLPNAVLEASAAGLPVVATRAGGTAELVVDETTGLLVEPGDIQALGEALLRMTDPRLAARLGAAGRARVLANFSWERTVRAHEELYASLGRRE
jgi:glycosyltransferase involved in cell wall biosynthesis